MYVTVLASTTSTTSAPSAATDGGKLPFLVDRGVILLYSTAGSGTMTVEGRVWGYNPDVALWFPLGNDRADSDNTAGMLNNNFEIGEAGTNIIRHAEEVQGLRAFTRVAVQVTAIAGTGTAVTGTLVCIPAAGVSQS